MAHFYFKFLFKPLYGLYPKDLPIKTSRSFAQILELQIAGTDVFRKYFCLWSRRIIFTIVDTIWILRVFASMSNIRSLITIDSYVRTLINVDGIGECRCSFFTRIDCYIFSSNLSYTFHKGDSIFSWEVSD